MSESPLGIGTSAPDGVPAERKRVVIGAGIAVGVLVLGGGGYLLLGRGGAGADTAFTPPVHHVAAASASATASASASPTASASPRAALAVFSGALGRDPFELPARVAGAAAPAVAPAAPASAAGATGAAATALPSSTPSAVAVSALPLGVVPATLGGPGAPAAPGAAAAPVATAPAPTLAGAPTTLPVQFLQLLQVRDTAHGWFVNVRTNNGLFTVREGTPDVGGTKFFFVGEDEQAGHPTFVFIVGESEGGNLVPNSRATAQKVKADDSTLILKHGQVDGGIYAAS